jgi:hypothetical protein
VIAACASTALIVVPSAIPQIVTGKTVFRTAELPSGATTSLAVSCPSGFYAVSAGIYKPAAGVTVLSTLARSVRSFTFRFLNPAGNPARRVVVLLACRRTLVSRDGLPHLRLRPIARPLTVRVPPGQKQARLTCPGGTVPAAAGFDLGRGSALTFRRQTQTLRSFVFGVANHGSAARTVSFHGSCLTLVRPPGGGGAQLQVSLTTDTIDVHPGTQVVTRACPRGWLSLAAGYSLPPGVTLGGAVAGLRLGRWSVTSTADDPVPAQLQLVCSRLSG